MGKNNPKSTGKRQQQIATRLKNQHNDVYMQVVQLYQELIEDIVEDDAPEETRIRAFIFKKCNAEWMKYCERNQKLTPRPDPRYFFNTIGKGAVDYAI